MRSAGSRRASLKQGMTTVEWANEYLERRYIACTAERQKFPVRVDPPARKTATGGFRTAVRPGYAQAAESSATCPSDRPFRRTTSITRLPNGKRHFWWETSRDRRRAARKDSPARNGVNKWVVVFSSTVKSR